MRKNKPIGIFSFTGVHNYGTQLQNYALGCEINSLGYDTESIYLYGRRVRSWPFYKFKKRYLKRSEPIFTFTHAKLLNDRYDKIVTGSDTVWVERIARPEMGMLAWATGEKTLLSYAASFGDSFYNGQTTAEVPAALLKRFDAISVREDSGVELCRDFGVRATHVLDPTLLAGRELFENLIAESDDDLELPGDYVTFYDAYGLPMPFIESIAAKFREAGQNLVWHAVNSGHLSTPAQWVNTFKNTRYVITNSYHGVCFSLLFNKPFILLGQSQSTSRYDSLFRMIGISPKRYRPAEISPDTIKSLPALDYAPVNTRLADLRKQSRAFLENALAIEPNHKRTYMECVFDLAPGQSEPNQENLDKWVEKYPFNPAMNTPLLDPLRFAGNVLLRDMFYAYETDDPEVLGERALARRLLLADARRIVDGQEYEAIRNNAIFKSNPHKLREHLWQRMVERHQDWLAARIKQLGGQKVYFLYDWDYKWLLENNRDLVGGLNVLAHLFVPAIEERELNGAPTYNLFPYILTAKPHPIVSFGYQPMTMLRRLRANGIDWPVIPCAFYNLKKTAAA